MTNCPMLRVLPGILALGLLAPALSAAPEEPRPPSELRAIELLRGLRDPAAPPPEVSGAQLAELGASTLGLLLDVLELRVVPGLERPEGEALPAQLLSRPQQETVLTAIGLLGRAPLLPLLEGRLVQPGTFAQRRAAIEALGAVAAGGDVDRLLEYARSEEADSDPRLFEPLQAAITSTLRRDGRGLRALSRGWRDLSPAVLATVIQGVGAARDARGLSLLLEIHEWAPDQRPLIASQVPLLGPADDPRTNSDLAFALLQQVEEGEPNAANAAILALGCLEDFASVPALVELLDSDSGAQRANAHHALCQLLNKSTRASAPPWRHWYRKEELWVAQRSRSVLEQLRERDPDVVRPALEELGSKRLERHELALAVCPVLQHPSPQIRAQACDVLLGLGSRWAIGDLKLALDDEAQEVRSAAHRALSAISKETRPPERAAWEDLPAPLRGPF